MIAAALAGLLWLSAPQADTSIEALSIGLEPVVYEELYGQENGDDE